ncbi:T-cell surface glycoprotein CD8 alpha chain [Pelodytes ibericus]
MEKRNARYSAITEEFRGYRPFYENRVAPCTTNFCSISKSEQDLDHTMRKFLSVLLLLNLISRSYQQIKLSRTSAPLQIGSTGPVMLECETPGLMDFGVFWFRQRKDTNSPESIMFLSSVSKSTYSGQFTSSNFESTKETSGYTLRIKSFGEKDQGIYYCIINKSSVLHISPGIHIYYPAVTTPKPKTTKAPVINTALPRPTEDPCICSSGKAPLNISCDLLIWAPLAGLCGVLLIALLTTSLLLCKRTRRRHCRCKHV